MKSISRIFILALLLSMFVVNSAQSQLIKTVVAVTGNVINQINREAESVQIFVFDNTGKKINSVKSNAAEGGYYYVTGLYPGNTYYFEVKDKEFLNERYEVMIPNTDKYIEISRDFLIKPKVSGTKFKLLVTPFESNKSKLRFGSSFLLNDLLNTLKSNPTTKFTIEAYPDNNDNSSKNEELTKKRAESLVDFFEVHGVDPSNLVIKGSKMTDSNTPLPSQKAAKGKKYIGPVYVIIN